MLPATDIEGKEQGLIHSLPPTGIVIRLGDVTKRNYEPIAQQIQEFIFDKKDEAGAEGAVIGLSGGIDSTVSAYLACKALGKEKVLGLIMPDSRVTPKQDVNDAKAVSRALQIESKNIDISRIHVKYMTKLHPHRVAEGNLRARIRMSILYYHANLLNQLVLGTGDRSEALIGYFTKYGDGGVDLQPLAGLYKTQVRELGRHLGVSTQIIAKKSSPRLWRGHGAEAEIGATYEDIDRILYAIFDLKLSEEQTAEETGLDTKLVDRVMTMHRQTAHKRTIPYSVQPSP
ncbi:MAG: NAD+ synthase [Thaumarchaeota archaeon]|nr:NAD+ synthase [Nitrososphaerota archaeon]